MADPRIRAAFLENERAWNGRTSGRRPVNTGETMVSALGNADPATEPESAAVASSGHTAPLLANRYEILGLIGIGGMGSVYRAHDRELDDVVALKMLRKDLVSTPGILERFRREVKLARHVTHANVARVFDIGEHEGEKFLTMELVEGESLGALLAREGALPLARVVEIVSGICAGLISVHAAGVIHRDLKPDNVLLALDGRVVLTDFGIARAFVEGSAGSTLSLLTGTPAYMAPEQVEEAQDIDGRADIYGLGVLIYELITGQRAWPGESPLAVATARLRTDPPDPRDLCPTLPATLSALVLTCIARHPRDRFQSVEALTAALSAITWSGINPLAPSPRRQVAVALAASRSPSAPPVLPSADKTVVVLPFRNTGPIEDDFLAEELTDDLIDSLSMTRGLKVRSRLGVLGARGTTQEPREIGRDLGVQVVVEGSVRRVSGSVRITARLISVADGFQLWAKRFDRPEQDVLSINDDASQAIAAALTLDRDAPAREAPSSPEAVDLYLRARHEYRKFWQENQAHALALFAQAEALAPGDPMILSGKALAKARSAFFTGLGVDEAITAAEQAIAVAPNLGEARLALGSALLQKGEWKLAVRQLRAAVVRAPGLADAHSAVGRVLVEVGDLDEAERRLEAAMALDPRTPLACEVLVRCHGLRGSWARSDEVLKSTPPAKRDIAYWTMRARMLLWKRDSAGAAVALEQLRARDGAAIVIARLLLEIVASRRPPAALEDRRMLDPTRAGSPRRKMFFLHLEAEMLAYLYDDLEPVLASVTRLVDNGLFDVCWMDGCPLLAQTRTDARFSLLRAVVKHRADEILDAYRAG